MIPTLVIVGADKGGVGKTTVARILLDYYQQNNIKVRAIDTEEPKGVLKRFFPEITKIVDLTKPAQQMEVFDTLRNYPVTLIDIRAGLLSPSLDTLKKTGFFDGARSGKLNIIVLHVLGGTVASYAEVKSTSEILTSARHILVKNHTNENSFFEWDSDVSRQAEIHQIGDEMMDIPKLTELATEYVDAAGVPFSKYVSSPDNSETLCGYIRTWMAQVYTTFDIAKLNVVGLG